MTPQSRTLPAVCILAISLSLLVGCASGPKKSSLPPDFDGAASASKSAAQKTLAMYRELKGYTNPDRAKLGKPLPHAYLMLNPLRNLPAGATFADALSHSSIHRVIYPIQNSNQLTYDSVVVHRKDGTWYPGVIGGDSVSTALVNLRDNLSFDPANHPDHMYGFSVPALNAFFLAHIDNAGNVILTPTSDYPEYNIRKGQHIDANTLLPRLIDAAKAPQGGGPG